jgi:hypothetical protein
MAAMSTVLEEFSDSGNSRTYVAPAHTVLKPALVIQKRQVAPSVNGASQDSVKVVFGTLDTAGAPHSVKDSIEIIVRRSPSGVDADLTAAVTLAREIVASSNFDAMVAGQSWLQ